MILERHIWLSFSCFLPHEVACPVISDSFPSWPWGLLWGLYFLLLPELLFHFALELALPLLEGLLQWAMIPKRLMEHSVEHSVPLEVLLSMNIGFLISHCNFSPCSKKHGKAPLCQAKKLMFVPSQGHVQMERKGALKWGRMAVIYSFKPLSRIVGYIVSIKDK